MPPCIACLIHLGFTCGFVLRHQRSAVRSCSASHQRNHQRSAVRNAAQSGTQRNHVRSAVTNAAQSAGTKSVLAVWCRCLVAPQQPEATTGWRVRGGMQAPWVTRRQRTRSCSQFQLSLADLVQNLRMRFECAGGYLSTPTTVV